MLSFTALKTDDASLGANSNLSLAVAALLAMPPVTMPAQDIAWSAIRDVLMNNWDWGSLVACTVPAGAGILAPGGAVMTATIKSSADALRECCLYGGMLRASDATVWAKLTVAANVLAATNVKGLSTASITAVSALRTPQVAKWAGIDAGMVQMARAQP